MTTDQPGYTGFTVSFVAAFRHDGGADLSYPTIKDVLPDTPAAAAGLMSGDVILEVNGVDARQGRALYATAGTRYAMKIRRGAEEREFVLVPEPKRSTPEA